MFGVYDHEHTKTVNKKIKDADGNVIRTEQAEVKVKVWQRVPCGGKLTIDLVEGVVSHRAPDASIRKCASKAPSGTRTRMATA